MSTDHEMHEGTLQDDGVHCFDGDCWCWHDGEEPDELYQRVKELVRVHGTDAVRGICDALEAEAREGDFGG